MIRNKHQKENNYDLLRKEEDDKLEQAISRKRTKHIHPYNTIIKRANEKMAKKIVESTPDTTNNNNNIETKNEQQQTQEPVKPTNKIEPPIIKPTTSNNNNNMSLDVLDLYPEDDEDLDEEVACLNKELAPTPTPTATPTPIPTKNAEISQENIPTTKEEQREKPTILRSIITKPMEKPQHRPHHQHHHHHQTSTPGPDFS